MNNLRNIRTKRGYSIQKLHEKTGIPYRTLQDWDSEKRQIQAYHRIKALSELLGCEMDELMTKHEKCIYNGHKASIKLSQREEGVYLCLVTLDHSGIVVKGHMARECALEMLEYIKEQKDIGKYLYNYTIVEE